MRKAMLGGLVGVMAMGVAQAVMAESGPYGFYAIEAATNFDKKLIEVRQSVLPGVHLEWAYGGKRFGIGPEISGLFYRNNTVRHGGELGFGVVLGGQAGLRVGRKWLVTVGGGTILSNPLSDEVGGEYLPGYEGNPDAERVRKPIHPGYIAASVSYRIKGNLGLRVGTHNSSPYVAIGFLLF